MTPQKKAKADLGSLLSQAVTEEDVKSRFASHFSIAYDTRNKIDLYTPEIAFEFKADRDLRVLKLLATTLAQLLYYIRRIKYEETERPMPQFLCVASKSTAAIFQTATLERAYTSVEYNWLMQPSSPDEMLVDALLNLPELTQAHVYDLTINHEIEAFSERLSAILTGAIKSDKVAKKSITEENFEDVFEYWSTMFADYVRNGQKPSKYFVTDIQVGKSYLQRDRNEVIFYFANGDARVKKIFVKHYDYFWSLYEKVEDQSVIKGILAKVDRLTDEFQRRFHGEFFTPVQFAKLALHYIEQNVQKQWWLDPTYRLWDMASGTGNLEYYLPLEAQAKCYLSTLYHEEVEHCKTLFPSAHVFQYDYLNDDVANLFRGNELDFGLEDWKLPKQLREDLRNKDLKWIILINPPFATAQTAGTSKKASKTDVSDTKIRRVMHNNDLGEASRELFSQFLFRIKHEFNGKHTHLALFSKVKYINSNNDSQLRAKIFDFKYVAGFLFHSKAFHGVKGNFPIGCLIWDLTQSLELGNQVIKTDVFDLEVNLIGQKLVKTYEKARFLSKWIKRPRTSAIFPPFASATNIRTDNKDIRNRVAPGFIASLMLLGNDYQHQNFTSILSGPYVSAGALSITKDNFGQAMFAHTVRRLPKATWLNDRDQFLAPDPEPDNELVLDCVIWSIWSNSNQCVSLGKVVYQNQTYFIDNKLFPFLPSVIADARFTDPGIRDSLISANPSFLAEWLEGKKLSAEASNLMQAGLELYKKFYALLHEIDLLKFKISRYDVGFYQVVQSLKDQSLASAEISRLKELHEHLGASILPRIQQLGCIAD